MKKNDCNDYWISGSSYCSTKPHCKPCSDKCSDKRCKPCCDKQCQKQSQGNLIQGQEQGDISQTQGDQTESQGDQSATQGDLSQTQGDQTESQGDQSATQGDQSQTQGDQTESQGDQSATQGDLSQTQGDQTESQGDQSATQGDQSQTQGDQTESQGDQSATQGDQSQTQGDQTESQGDQSATQGDQSQTQGDQTESQGDQSATQGDLSQTQGDQTESQGDQSATQGDLSQTQGGQTQGDQMQTMTGHGGQVQGAQTLISAPTISTPVDVSGVNVNVTVTCCDDKKKDRKDFHKDCDDCQVKCRESITGLLSLINTLSLPISDPSASLIEFFHCELDPTSTIGNLGNVTDCTFSVVPESGENEITFITDTLDALCIEPAAISPNLFELLLSYLQSVPDSVCNNDDQKKASKFVCDCCFETIELQLQAFFAANVQLEINIGCESFTGFIFKICNGIIYLVDDLTVPTIIYAIPICKILSYQPQ